MVVHRGRMQTWVAGELYPLAEGNSITFDTAPHRALNPYEMPTIVLGAISPTSF